MIFVVVYSVCKKKRALFCFEKKKKLSFFLFLFFFSHAVFSPRRTKFTGFSGFPESIVRSKKLRTLWLQDHRAVVVASPGISNLRNLRELAVTMCSLRALPAELGALRGLTRLGFTMNRSYLVGAGGARLRVALK